MSSLQMISIVCIAKHSEVSKLAVIYIITWLIQQNYGIDTFAILLKELLV